MEEIKNPGQQLPEAEQAAAEAYLNAVTDYAPPR